MRVRFTREALAHIAGIRSYIAGYSPRAADRVADRIFAETDRLGEFPRLGRSGQVSGTCEWTVPGLPYIIVYQSGRAEGFVVLGVFHGAQCR